MPMSSPVMTTHTTNVVQITASQLLDKLSDASTNVAQSRNCEFAAISHYISETVQASVEVTTECEYEVSNDVISSDLE